MKPPRWPLHPPPSTPAQVFQPDMPDSLCLLVLIPYSEITESFYFYFPSALFFPWSLGKSGFLHCTTISFSSSHLGFTSCLGFLLPWAGSLDQVPALPSPSLAAAVPPPCGSWKKLFPGLFSGDAGGGWERDVASTGTTSPPHPGHLQTS